MQNNYLLYIDFKKFLYIFICLLKISLHINKQEKAFKQLATIVICFTFCFLPYFICFVIVAFCEDCVSERQYTLTIWLGYLNSALNPFLYALLNKSSPKNPIFSRRPTSSLTRLLERLKFNIDLD